MDAPSAAKVLIVRLRGTTLVVVRRIACRSRRQSRAQPDISQLGIAGKQAGSGGTSIAKSRVRAKCCMSVPHGERMHFAATAEVA